MDFTNKRVLVTGGSRGIGFAVAKTFLDAGAYVAINGRTMQTVGAAIERLGDGEFLVAAPAGIGAGRPIEDCDEAMWDAHVDVNLKGTFFCCRAALSALRKSNGNIVNIASDAGLMGCIGIVVYCASKAGVVNMTRAMALEIAPDVRVNCVCPGYVDTDMIRNSIAKAEDPSAKEQMMIDYAPLKRIAMPEEISHAVLYLASSEASFITGAALAIDGGTTAGR